MADVGLKIKLGAVDNVSKTLNRVTSKLRPLRREARRLTNRFKLLQDRTAGFRKSVSRMGASLRNVGKKMSMYVTAPIVAGMGFALKQFMKVEDALVGVGKTTDIQGKALGRLGEKFKDLADRMPVAVTELLAFGQVAGQLGVKGSGNILKFSETIAKLGSATDIAGEDAAMSLTTLLNLTSTGIGKIDRLASTIVRLGNNFNATESQITAVASEVGKATAQFGVSPKQVVALSTAMRALGIQAESGGSVIGMTFNRMNKAVLSGGKPLRILAKITGKTGKEISKIFSEDSMEAFRLFTHGLNKLGKKSILALDAFGVTGLRVAKVLPVLAKKVGSLDKALSMANDEWEANTALNEEAGRAFSTTSSKAKMAMNRLRRLAGTVGEMLVPAFIWLVEKLKSTVRWFKEHPKITKWAVAFAAVAAALGPLLIMLGVAIGSVGGLTTIATALGVTLGAVLAALGTIGITIVALVTIGALLIANWDSLQVLGKKIWGGILGDILTLTNPLLWLVGIAETILEEWNPLLGFFENLANVIGGIGSKVKGLFGRLVGFLPGLTLGMLKDKADAAKRGNAERATFGPRRDLVGDNKVNGPLKSKADVNINFSNIPKGTIIKTESDNDLGINVNTGLQGAYGF